MAENLNQALDRLAAQVGLSFTSNLLDPIQPDSVIAARKAAELKQFLDTRKQVAGEQAKSDLLSGAALIGAGATPPELAAFKPGLPSVLDLSTPASGAGSVPPATGNPPVLTPSVTPEAQRLDVLDAAGIKNAPAVETMRRSLALHDTGLNEAAIAQARVSGQHERLYGATADVAVARRDALTNILNDPALDPLLKNEIAQNKVSFKSQRVKVQHKDGTVGYYDATPNLSGGTDYAQALDENGDPISAPVGAGAGDRSTALQKNAAFLARVLYGNEPDAEQKAVTMLTQLKTKSPRDAWASLTMAVSKLNVGRYARDPQKLHDKTAELWRISRPGEAIPSEAPPSPVLAPAPGGPTAAAKPDEPFTPAAASRLKEGKFTTFGNGQVWTLSNGQPSRVR